MGGSSEPVKVAALGSAGVTMIAAGDAHVLAASESRLWAWGCGELGRLGLGGEEEAWEPAEVALLSPALRIRRIFAGPDASALLLRSGRVLAFGSNAHNKLALNPVLKGLEVPFSLLSATYELGLSAVS